MSRFRRVVIDTNVVVSAFVFRAGRLAWLSEAVVSHSKCGTHFETVIILIRLSLGSPLSHWAAVTKSSVQKSFGAVGTGCIVAISLGSLP